MLTVSWLWKIDTNYR